MTQCFTAAPPATVSMVTSTSFLGCVRGWPKLTQPLASANLTISTSRLGDRAGTLGAAVMVADSVFSAAAVDARLEAATA